jgi:DNA-binding response OmpR family regulator
MPAAYALRVLIVDDERLVADTLGMIVEAKGHVACVAYSGEQATALAAEFKPDAVISDVMMPGMDGFELATWLEEHDYDCKVLLVSGHMEYVARAEQIAQSGRPRAVLPKPVHPHEVLRFLTTCISQRSQAK